MSGLEKAPLEPHVETTRMHNNNACHKSAAVGLKNNSKHVVQTGEKCVAEDVALVGAFVRVSTGFSQDFCMSRSLHVLVHEWVNQVLLLNLHCRMANST